MILGITTAPRPNGFSYLSKTIDSAFSAGFDSIVVFAEPGTDVYDVQWGSDFRSCDAHRNVYVLGNYGNFKAMATSVLNRASSTETIVTAEDDVLFCENAAKKIEEQVNKLRGDDFGLFAAYSSSVHQTHLEPNSVASLKTTSLWGACCLAWTKESLQSLLDHKIFKEWRGLDDNRPSVGDPKIKHVDTCISMVMDKLNRKMYFCRPSLVRHVGIVSSLRKKPFTDGRDCLEFSGEQN